MEQIATPRKLQEPQDLNKRDLKKEDRGAPDLFAATLSMHLHTRELRARSDGPSEQRPNEPPAKEIPKKLDVQRPQVADAQQIGESAAPELPDALKEAAETLQSYIQGELSLREPSQTTSTQTELLLDVHSLAPPGQSSLGQPSEVPLSEQVPLVEVAPAEPLMASTNLDEATKPSAQMEMSAEELPPPDAPIEGEEVVEVPPEPERISTHDELEATFSLQDGGAAETSQQDLGSGAKQSSHGESSASSGWDQPDAPALSLGQSFQGELKSAQQTSKHARALAQEMVTRVLEANSKTRLLNRRLSIAIPMEGGEAIRLVLTPGSAGDHKLALVSANASQREQLKRALPEIESAAAELPLTITEILVDAHEASHPIEPSAHTRVEAVRRHPE